MVVCEQGKIAYFDVDDTLLEWFECSRDTEGAVKFTNNGHTFYKKAIDPNIAALKEHSHAGHIVVVWSQGGSKWAENVIKTLQLKNYVDFVLTKPDWYYDDKEANKWMPKRQFKKEL